MLFQNDSAMPRLYDSTLLGGGLKLQLGIVDRAQKFRRCLFMTVRIRPAVTQLQQPRALQDVIFLLLAFGNISGRHHVQMKLLTAVTIHG
jgi:hypothetical protein